MQLSKQHKNLIRWIEALISGDYNQGYGALVGYNSCSGKRLKCHCANGVALEEFGFTEIGGKYYFGFDADSITELASSAVAPRNWFRRTFGTYVNRADITAMNDLNKMSFPQIALYLSQFLPDSPEKERLQHRIDEIIWLENSRVPTVTVVASHDAVSPQTWSAGIPGLHNLELSERVIPDDDSSPT